MSGAAALALSLAGSGAVQIWAMWEKAVGGGTGCKLAEQSDRLTDVGRGVVDEARWLHRWFSVRAKFMCMLNLDSTKSTRSKYALLLKDGGLVVRLGVNVRGRGAQQEALWHYAKRGTSAHISGDDVVEEILGADQESLPRQRRSDNSPPPRIAHFRFLTFCPIASHLPRAPAVLVR